jgi:hypothetical protein
MTAPPCCLRNTMMKIFCVLSVCRQSGGSKGTSCGADGVIGAFDGWWWRWNVSRMLMNVQRF